MLSFAVGIEFVVIKPSSSLVVKASLMRSIREENPA